MAISEQPLEKTRKQASARRLCRMATMLVYLSINVAWPFPIGVMCRTLGTDAEPLACSCPMCTVDGQGIHHCSCCNHNDRCECGISADPDDQGVAVFLETGILVTLQEFLPLPASSPNVSLHVQLLSNPALKVPTPPPEV